jgi:hypothetical protein
MEFELNTEGNIKDSDVFANAQLNSKSPVVEIFSALASGADVSKYGKKADKVVEHMKGLSGKALAGDATAVAEINTIVKYAIEPKLLESIKLFSFMGKYKKIGYDTQPMVKTYKYESIDSRFQASSGDVPFAAHSFREYPISTKTISSGYAVDYRELQSGNFDGTVAEGMQQVQIDMHNKAVYYVIAVMYNSIKNATGVKHFAESNGITETGVKDIQRVMRRYGKVTICGDYSVVSQMNDFAGFKTFAGGEILRYGADAVAEEIRKTGLLNYFNGSSVVELENGFNFTKMNADKSSYELYLPEGLLFFVPQAEPISPLQIFLRGGLTSMTGSDVVTRQHITRFDMEIGADVAKGLENWIGLLADTNFDVPQLP